MTETSMKLLLIPIVLFFTFTCYSQVTVDQSVLDRCANTADQLIAAKAVITKFENERSATDAERVAAQTLIKSLNDVLELRGRMIGEYERMNTLYQKVIEMQQVIIDKLTKELNKTPSSWQKFVKTLERIAILASGVAIGRGL